MATNTTNFNWIKPTVGSDADVWGGYLDANLDSQDTLIRKSINQFISNTAPTEAQNGTFWINNTTNPWVLSVYSGTTWIAIGDIDTVNDNFVVSSENNFIGDLKVSAQPSNHGSWLICDGSAISRTTYSGLFTLFNTLSPQLPFGIGDGVTTFNIPDLRGQVAGSIGTGAYPGATTRTIGQFVGEESHILSVGEIPAHTHNWGGTSNAVGGGTTSLFKEGTQSLAPTSSTGGGAAHNTMQPTLFAGNYFIYTGV